MRSIALATLLLLLSAGAYGEDAKPPAKPPKPPPPPGIHWELDLEAGLQRAAREGRPVLFAVNALETERANNQLAEQAYRSKAWGAATRGYVAFVCNPNDHAEGIGACTRYPGHTCASHKAALDWFLKRFGDALISPQHVILEPDGDVAYRKEYFTYIVSPTLLDSYLSNLAPNVAYARAAFEREKEGDALARTPLDELEATARAWLGRTDGLSAAAITGVLDDCYDKARRTALIAALGDTPRLQAPVLAVAAEGRMLYPTDEAAETLQWLRTLFAVDRETGVWGATRVLARLEDEGERDQVLRIWADKEHLKRAPRIDDLAKDEQSAAYEALLLAGDRRGTVTRVPEAFTQGRKEEIRRARRVRGQTTVVAGGLESALANAPPGRLRRLLLSAPPEEVRANEKDVRKALTGARPVRVRVAAALALLRAKAPGSDLLAIQHLILTALDDAIEGRSTRIAAVAILSDDPGQSREEWKAALAAHLNAKGGAK